ncbi:hypothetical protein Tco_0838660 [Tanacetum coccineum]|uniref:Uncharacterized protein n=1 Tax=Tanacetum coccineum TaxID=301880 RepID=A0ABQ5ASH6_9ASTR
MAAGGGGAAGHGRWEREIKRVWKAKQAQDDVDLVDAPRGYRKIAMTGCVLTLRAPNDPDAPPPSITQKRNL